MRYLSRIKSDPIVFMVIIFVAIVALFPQGKKAAPPEAGKPVAVKEAKLPGKIVFDNAFHDFGEVLEGDVVKHTFPFKNEGPGPVKIVDTKTSCGCTTAKGALKEYAPGETGEMEVTIDTKGKKGIVVKTVDVMTENNDISKIEISLTAKLITPPHPKVENVLFINTDPACKSCHLDNGVGQTGIFLYHRVCGQCHGKKGKGASASPLNDGKWTGAGDDAYIRKAITSGIPERGMPPYVDGVNPALTPEQIDSLIDYIHQMEREKE